MFALLLLAAAFLLYACTPPSSSSGGGGGTNTANVGKGSGGTPKNKVETLKSGVTITTKGTDSTRHLVIDSSVMKISQGEFANKNLTSIVLPDTITNITGFAFNGNPLKEVILPQRLYDARNSLFGVASSRNIVFHLYDASKPGKKGRKLP